MDRLMGLITANYQTPELGLLTEDRTIASLPFAGRYRLIDFPLSNMINAGITAVGLVTPYKYRSIIDHVGAGKPWSLNRKNGGLFILPGSVFGVQSGESKFLLRDLERNRMFLTGAVAPYLLVTGASCVCTMDYNDVLEAHLKSGADITMVTVPAGEDNPHVSGLKVKEGKVLGVTHGVKAGGVQSLDCFIIATDFLLKLLDWYKTVNYLDLFDALAGDYDKLEVRTFEYTGYARPIYDVKSYYDAGMDMLNPAVAAQVWRADLPIQAKVNDAAPAQYLQGACVRNSLISAGCTIGGTVENSILSSGVVVKPGAVVRNTVLMKACVIEAGAEVDYGIFDKGNVVPAGAVLKGTPRDVLLRGKPNA